ncbi:MAG: hypothetical protein ABW104_13775 [Candidatus Thiodiazotropha sp. 6PLUC2]
MPGFSEAWVGCGISVSRRMRVGAWRGLASEDAKLGSMGLDAGPGIPRYGSDA